LPNILQVSGHQHMQQQAVLNHLRPNDTNDRAEVAAHGALQMLSSAGPQGPQVAYVLQGQHHPVQTESAPPEVPSPPIDVVTVTKYEKAMEDEVKMKGSQRIRPHRLCSVDTCGKRAQTGGFCRAHGGRKLCSVDGCDKTAYSGGMCKPHGGGKRCTHEGCSKSAHSGGLCKAHGGGKRCTHEGCSTGAESGGLCKAHGGGQRCRQDRCTKGAQVGGMCKAHCKRKLCYINGCENVVYTRGMCKPHDDGTKRLKRDDGEAGEDHVMAAAEVGVVPVESMHHPLVSQVVPSSAIVEGIPSAPDVRSMSAQVNLM